MMRVRCQYCSWMVVLKPDEIAAGIASAAEQKSAHHVLNCPKCRKVIKISVKQMKRQLPRGYQPPVPQNDAKEDEAAEAPAEEES